MGASPVRKIIRDKFRQLARCSSGNAAILVAMGMPVLLGGAGLGVDVAQWYMWKRELQYAADQGAIAGAWAKGQRENSNTYQLRVEQEFTGNLSMTAGFASDPVVSLEDYDGGTDNSIQVVATATNELPFTSFFMDGSTTIEVTAQAIYEPEAVYDPCLLALDDSAPRALWFHGGPIVNAQCGSGAISDADNAISFEGSGGEYDLGFLITAGRVSDNQGHTEGTPVVEGATNLQDPFEGLEPPDNNIPRTYACDSSEYEADRTVTVTTTYSYYTGRNKNSLTPIDNYAYAKSGGTETSQIANYQLARLPKENPSTATTQTLNEIVGGGNEKVWELERVVTVTSYGEFRPSGGSGTQLPGTYSDFKVSCDTTLAPGVFVIDGGDLEISSDHKVTGTGVMFVLKNGAGLKITGGSAINLTAMSLGQLIEAGVSAEDAPKMLGMLIFEDPESSGSDKNKLTGNSASAFNGIVYLPNSGIELLGTQRGVSQCLVIASARIEVGGTANLSNLCPANATPLHRAAVQRHTVRLVK